MYAKILRPIKFSNNWVTYEIDYTSIVSMDDINHLKENGVIILCLY